MTTTSTTCSYELLGSDKAHYDHQLHRQTYRNVSKLELLWANLPNTVTNVVRGVSDSLRYVRLTNADAVDIPVANIVDNVVLTRGRVYNLTTGVGDIARSIRVGDVGDDGDTYALPCSLAMPITDESSVPFVVLDESYDVVRSGSIALVDEEKEVKLDEGAYTLEQLVNVLNLKLRADNVQITLDPHSLVVEVEAFANTTCFYLVVVPTSSSTSSSPSVSPTMDLTRLLGFRQHHPPQQQQQKSRIVADTTDSPPRVVVTSPLRAVRSPYPALRVGVGHDLPSSFGSFAIPIANATIGDLSAHITVGSADSSACGRGCTNPVVLNPPRDLHSPMRVTIDTMPDGREFTTLDQPHAMLLRVTHEL